MNFVKTDDEAIAPTTNHCNRPTVVCISRRKNDLYKRILTNDTRLQKSQRLGQITSD